MERFDKVQRERANPSAGAAEPAPTTNGAAHDGDVAETTEKDGDAFSPSNKRKASTPPEDDDEELSDVKDTPPPKKAKKSSKPKVEAEETDKQMARRLAAEYAAPGRATRGGGAKPKKAAPVKKSQGKSKKKSAAKINSDDDSEIEGGSTSPKPEKEKKGGFHKPMNLSEPLQDLLGESQMSRPQTVKKIWEYVRAHDLQDPKDKRNIRCDDKMRAVFKSDKIHMFTMNKVLAGQLYPVEE